MGNRLTTAEPVEIAGKPSILITCLCSTHPEGMNSAIIVGRESFPVDRIHGFVLMAHHPAALIRKGAEQSGVRAA